MAPVLAVGRAGYFYPRSPCGERRNRKNDHLLPTSISIHALLAESDQSSSYSAYLEEGISIHALLAESDLFSR